MPENVPSRYKVFISGISESIMKLLIANSLQCLDMLMIALTLGKTTFYISLSTLLQLLLDVRLETRFQSPC